MDNAGHLRVHGLSGGGWGGESKHTALIDRTDTYGSVALGLLVVSSSRTAAPKDGPSQKTGSSCGYAWCTGYV